jgi:transposase-like protein
MIEAVLDLSAEKIAGPRHQGIERPGEVHWYGTQPGSVRLSDRKLRVDRPRLRKKGHGDNGELDIPAYQAMQGGAIGQRLLQIVLSGVSTRDYEAVLPEMAETAGVSKSAVSRELIEASGEELRRLCERRFDAVDLPVIYIDGVRQGEHLVVVALGVDASGNKHVLGLREGATENTVVVRGLLEDLVTRGVKPDRKRLFVVDGARALRNAIDEVYGIGNLVQRCRNHKVENVTEHLPKELKPTVKAAMKAAYRLDADEGIKRLRKQAEWLAKESPSAAASLEEGLEETFTVNRLGLPASLRRCLGTTNLIENPNSGIRRKTGRVTRWRDGEMVLRWTASALLASEKKFRKVMGYEHLWMLEAALTGTALDSKKGFG